MYCEKKIRTVLIGVVAFTSPLMFAIGGSGTASAGPDLCVTGPYGYASACVDVPVVDIDYDGPRRGPKHWKHGHGH